MHLILPMSMHLILSMSMHLILPLSIHFMHAPYPCFKQSRTMSGDHSYNLSAPTNCAFGTYALPN